MAKTVLGLIENSEEAQKAVQELLQSGFDRKEVGVVSSDMVRETAATVAGASKGIAIGSLAGLLVGAAALAIPGIGLALVAGPAVPLLGATFGALAGGLIGGLTARGVPEEDAHKYAEGVRRGATLIVVTAKTDELAQRAAAILKRHGARDIDEHAEAWRKQGWSGRFESRAQPESERAGAAPAPGAQPQAAPAPAAQARSAQSEGRETVQAQRPEPAVEESMVPDEPVVALEGVRVYSFVIEMPEDEAAAAAAAPEAGRQPRRYAGPERRTRRAGYSGMERRAAL